MSYDGLLINTCDVVEKTVDTYGRITGESVTAGVQCRWMFGYRRALDEKGEEIISVAKVFFKATAAIKSHFYLRYMGVEYKIVKVLTPQDSAVLHHKEVYVN